MYLISVYFDKKTNKKIQNLIDEVASRTGNPFMTENRVPPHITISSFETRNEQRAIDILERTAGNLVKGEIRIVSVGQFMPYVLYIQALQNQYLYDLSMKIYEEVSQLDETIISEYYQPLSWIPHITIGKKLSREQMQTAFQVLQDKFVPASAMVQRIGIAKPNPHRDLRVIDMETPN